VRIMRGGRPSGWATDSGGAATGPWSGRILGLLLLALALAAIYQGASGQAVWRDLSSLVGAAPPRSTPAMRTSEAADLVPPLAGEPAALGQAGADVAAYVGQAQRHDWSAAATSLRRLERTWTQLAPELADGGVPALELNTFTTLMTDALARVATHDRAGAASDARLLTSQLGVLTVAWVGSQAPTYTELADLSRDLGGAVKARSWTRVAADAQDLSMLVSRIGQGF
jgi:hypothetical protein